MRFGAMAAEARNNGSADFKVPCAAERLVVAATSPSRFLVVCNRRERGRQSVADSTLCHFLTPREFYRKTDKKLKMKREKRVQTKKVEKSIIKK